MITYYNYSLLSRNTFGIDVKTDKFVEYESVDELVSILADIKKNNTPYLHIGEGSNLLFTEDFNGTILHSLIKDISIVAQSDSFVDIKVGAGVNWDEFVQYTVSQTLYGAENLSYIPGEVGASAVQNIGAYGKEAKDIILSVQAIDINSGEERIFTNEECKYSYRESVFKKEYKNRFIITYVTYRLSKIASFDLDYGNVLKELDSAKCDVNLENVRNIIIKIRKDKLPDPKEYGNAGSFFMNPVVGTDKFNELIEKYPSMPYYNVGDNGKKIPAAWLIEQCGFKGYKKGNVAVHHIQPLVLVNLGGAYANEIIALAKEVADAIDNKFGIRIIPEVNYI